jgi:hypothetical protein
MRPMQLTQRLATTHLIKRPSMAAGRGITLVVLCLALCLAETGEASEPAACLQRWPAGGLNMAGDLGGEQVRGYLHDGHPADREGGISGVFIFPGRWPDGEVALSMSGVVTPDCEMELEDVNDGVWRLRFAAEDRVDGTVELPDGAVPIALAVVPPKDCSGDEPWLEFHSEDWPVSFEYPSSWWIRETEDGIFVECPSAARFAWGGTTIFLQRGRGMEPVETRRDGRGIAVGRFLRLRSGEWLLGLCDTRHGDGLNCNPARKSEHLGMAVLQGSAGEHRLYRAGGGRYLGQGDGIVEYVFLLSEDRWVRMQSDVAPAFIDQMRSPGPVIFEGDGVTERLVRSVRPR